MKIIKSFFSNSIKIIQITKYDDDRGFFIENYNYKKLKSLGIHDNFVQDNFSFSKNSDIIRGLHFQKPKKDQSKLISVIKGSILDIFVDIRKKSNTFGKYFKIVLSERNFKMLWIPPGFAHGFETLEDNTIFAYKVTNEYNKESEDCILWNDSTLKIEWETENPLVSDKDRIAKNFEHFNSLF